MPLLDEIRNAISFGETGRNDFKTDYVRAGLPKIPDNVYAADLLLSKLESALNKFRKDYFRSQDPRSKERKLPPEERIAALNSIRDRYHAVDGLNEWMKRAVVDKFGYSFERDYGVPENYDEINFALKNDKWLDQPMNGGWSPMRTANALSDFYKKRGDLFRAKKVYDLYKNATPEELKTIYESSSTGYGGRYQVYDNMPYEAELSGNRHSWTIPNTVDSPEKLRDFKINDALDWERNVDLTNTGIPLFMELGDDARHYLGSYTLDPFIGPNIENWNIDFNPNYGWTSINPIKNHHENDYEYRIPRVGDYDVHGKIGQNPYRREK